MLSYFAVVLWRKTQCVGDGSLNLIYLTTSITQYTRPFLFRLTGSAAKHKIWPNEQWQSLAVQARAGFPSVMGGMLRTLTIVENGMKVPGNLHIYIHE